MITKTYVMYIPSKLQQQVGFIIDKTDGGDPKKYGAVVVKDWGESLAFVKAMVAEGWSWKSEINVLTKKGYLSLYILPLPTAAIVLKGVSLALAVSLVEDLPSELLERLMIRLRETKEICVYSLEWASVLRVVKLKGSKPLGEVNE